MPTIQRRNARFGLLAKLGYNIHWLLLLGLLSFAMAVPAAALTITAPVAAKLDDSWQNHNGIRYVASNIPFNGAVTMRSLVALQDGAGWDNMSAATLAGWSTAAHKPADALALNWQQEDGAWFPKWTLSLESATGLLTKPYKLLDVSPINGHQYEALLSYNPSTGAISYRFTDITSGELIHAGGLQGAPCSQPLYGTLGYRSSVDKHLQTSAELYTSYLPVGNTWQLVTKGPLEVDPPLAITRIERTQKAFTQLSIPVAGGSANSGYRFIFQSADGETSSVSTARTVGDHLAPLPVGDLAFGTTAVNMHYIVDNQVLITDSKQLTLGKLALQFANFKHESHTIGGQLVLHTDGSIPANSSLTVHASVYRLTWDSVDKVYKSSLYQEKPVFSGSIHPEQAVDYSMPAPTEAGFWQVVLRPTLLIPGVQPPPLETTGVQQTFTTYAPAQVTPGDAYSIVLFSDTQAATYYQANRGYILDRQTLWVAENAQAKNITLALQVGDLTELNQPVEWERAQHSFNYLDGVVPYVLAVGNHDMLLNSYEKMSREAPLLNQYFPMTKFPHLGGTFSPGSINNSYYLLDIAEEKYLVVSIEYAPRNEVLTWVNQVISAHPERKVILVTHHFLTRSGFPVAPGQSSDLPQYSHIARNPGETTNDGLDIWLKVGRLHKNMFMIISGHISVSTIPYNVGQGVNGNRVYQILTDYQSEPNGGNGWLVLLKFTPENTIEVQAYSPYLSQNKTDRDQNGYSNSFIIDLSKSKITQR